MFNLKKKLEEKKQAEAAAQSQPQAASKQSMSPSDVILRKDIASIDIKESLAQLVFPSPDDLRHFSVVLKPDTGIWAGGQFKFTFDIPSDYNMSPPKVRCETRVLHPNIDSSGGVCLNILRDEWTPSQSLQSIILGLLHLFFFPNPDDPLDHDAAELMKSDLPRFERTVRHMLQGRSYHYL